jgi:beta-galactosidase
MQSSIAFFFSQSRISRQYVCDEANIETDGMKPQGRLANDWGWENTFVSRVRRMVQRDWNHPSIIMWSLGNESGRGRNLVQARKTVLELDTSRPICYESGKTMGKVFWVANDIIFPLKAYLYSFQCCIRAFRWVVGRRSWQDRTDGHCMPHVPRCEQDRKNG